jgi:TatD DNase family protein
MKLIDVHAHLESGRFGKDLDSVIERFKEAGGKVVINSGVNPETNRKSLELAEKYDVVKVSFGLYPIDALAKEVEESSEFLRKVEAFDVDEELDWIKEHKDECVAIGEIGLDYNWPEFQSDEIKEAQKDVFRKVLRLAKKIGKPVVVHSRKAERDAVEILEEMEMKDVVMHCFCGRKGLIKRGVENGWFFSLAPAIKRWQNFQMIAEMVPICQLLTETDSPFLSPVFGERNEPANVGVTVKEIARIKGIGVDEVAEQIFKNAKKLFGLNGVF